jgi:hypothetical protein
MSTITQQHNIKMDKKLRAATPIQFLIKGITTEQFALNESAFKEGQPAQVSTNIAFSTDVDNRLIGTFVRFDFLQNGFPIIILEVALHFQIKEESWSIMYDVENKETILSKAFAIHLAFLVIGTARGVLHTKVENTVFNKFIVPTIDLTKMFDDEVTVKPSELQYTSKPVFH